MTELGAWLKELIMIVLLAVFTDLLLPTKAMQKYVRTVLGLAIIAAMLQPIVPFFRTGWADRTAQIAVSEVDQGATTGSTSPSSATGDYTGVLQSQQNNEANQLLGQQILSAMPASERQVVTSVLVLGAGGNLSGIRVTVNRTLGGPSSQDIQNWLANYLNILPAQVSVNG